MLAEPLLTAIVVVPVAVQLLTLVTLTVKLKLPTTLLLNDALLSSLVKLPPLLCQL